MCKEMLENKHYKKIGSLAGTVSENLKLMKHLHSDNCGRLPGFSSEFCKRGKDIASFGIPFFFQYPQTFNEPRSQRINNPTT